MDEILIQVVKQCINKGILKDTSLSVDCTHTHANTFKAVPERVMKYLAKKIFKNLEEENGQILEGLNTTIPQYKEIEDHKQAKETMKQYLEEVIEKVKENIKLEDHPKTQATIENAKMILSDPKFIQQRGLRSLVDQDARVGYKSKTESFFGYKTEYLITTKERIITAVKSYDGAYVDGNGFEELMDLSNKTGMIPQEVYGDKTYFRKQILDTISENQAQAYIPVSESVYRIDESRYSYNKDSDQWVCDFGNYTIEKKRFKKKDGREFYKYKFDKQNCRDCPYREECLHARAKVKILDISINTPEFYEYSQ
ncbi:hypothetical protein Gferi_21050 [Geosporobacter ferrireducens]|uniref:Transposase IS4-like domain-containing protein n=1 Tax=Geosporobacter ferrireducens TaxID=1424294 RepID=A0A1D8GLL8_9FIRM|nr:hypothetical protein Gferi_21050 [Geosporobacter ferrireducens]